MKVSSSYAEAFKRSSTPQDVLVHLGLMSLHAEMKRGLAEKAPEYAALMEESLGGYLRERKVTPKGTYEELVKRLNQEAHEQPQLPFPEEQIPRKPLDDLLVAIEKLRPIIWHDPELGGVTIRMAVESRDLMKKVVEIVHLEAVAIRRKADEANFLYRAILNVAERTE